MSKRVNNAKGVGSKNKGDTKRLRTLRKRKEALLKMKQSGTVEDKINTKGKQLFDALSSSIRAITPKRFTQQRNRGR